MSEHVVYEAIKLVREAYQAVDNDRRRAAVEQLLYFESSLDKDTGRVVGLGLMQADSESYVVQSYGAVILKKGLVNHLLQPADIPFEELVQWFWGTAGLPRLLEKDLLELLVEAVLRLPDSTLLGLFGLCANPSSQDQWRKQMLLVGSLVASIMEPSVESARIPGIGALQTCVRGKAASLIEVMLPSLKKAYENEEFLFLCGCETIGRPVEAIACLAPHLSPSDWVRLSLVESLVALLGWPVSQKFAVLAVAMIIQSLRQTPSPELMTIRSQLVRCLTDTAMSCLTDLELLSVAEEILEFMGEVDPAVLMHSGVENVAALSLCALEVPSLRLASHVCSVLLSVENHVMSQISVYDLCERLYLFLQKHALHPTSGTHPVGAMLSQSQLVTDAIYDQTFGDVRNAAGKCLNSLSLHQPEQSNAYILHRIQQLPDPCGTAEDPRTPFGCVTQQSRTFALWDATAFMVVRMCKSFSRSHAHVADAMTCLRQRNTSDAVLRPCYLDMLRAFWSYEGPDAQTAVWSGTLDILLGDLENSKPASEDEDVLSARRRVGTLLISITKYASRFRDLVPGVVDRLRPMLLRAKGPERSYLYEAASYFCMSLNAEEGDTHLRELLHPILEYTERLVLSIDNQEEFNRLMVEASRESRDRRHQLKEALSIFCSSLKVDTQSPYVAEIAGRLQPVLCRTFYLVHGMLNTQLPPPFHEIIYMHISEAKNFLYGNPRKSCIDRSPVGEARSTLGSLLFGLYQLHGLLSRFLPPEAVMDSLQGLRAQLSRIPMHWMRTCVQQDLLVVLHSHPEMAASLFSLLGEYCRERPFASPLRIPQVTPEQEDSIRSKMWRGMMLCVTIEMFEKMVLETDRWKHHPDELRAGCDFLLEIGRTSSAEIAAKSLRKAMQLEGTVEVDADLLRNIHMYAFRCVVSIIIHTTDPTFSAVSLEKTCYSVARFFLENFESAIVILSELSPATDAMEDLRRVLLVTSREGAQIQKCKEFLLKLRGSTAAGLPHA